MNDYVISMKKYRKMRKRKRTRAIVKGLALRGILFLGSILAMILTMIGIAHV